MEVLSVRLLILVGPLIQEETLCCSWDAFPGQLAVPIGPSEILSLVGLLGEGNQKQVPLDWVVIRLFSPGNSSALHSQGCKTLVVLELGCKPLSPLEPAAAFWPWQAPS